jgi:hypothetical protein
MAINPKDIRPTDLARQAYSIALQSWQRVAFAGGVFALIASFVPAVASLFATYGFGQIGTFTSIFIMLLASLSAAMVTSARVLDVEVAYLPSALIHERLFWRYVLAGLVCPLLIIALFLGAFVVVSSNLPENFASLARAGKLNLFTSDYLLLHAAIIAAVVGMVVLTVRLSLMLPAVVIGEKVSVGKSWRRTRGIAWRLLLAMATALMPFYLATYIVRLASAAQTDPTGFIFYKTLSVVITLSKAAVEGALFGLVMLSVIEAEDELSDAVVSQAEIDA